MNRFSLTGDVFYVWAAVIFGFAKWTDVFSAVWLKQGIREFKLGPVAELRQLIKYELYF